MSGWNPIDSPENPVAEPVYEPEILTPALAAQWVSEEGPGITADIAMDDLIHGRTVVIRKWTEAQAREWVRDWFDGDRAELSRLDPWALAMIAGLACARALGAIVEDGK